MVCAPRQGWATLALTSVLLVGCGTKVTVVPAVEAPGQTEFVMAGRIVYEGKREYLPRTLVEGPAPADVVLRYAFEVAYGKDRTHASVHLFNPLVMFGFPIGEDTVAVAGRLEIERRNVVIKTYTATCGFKKTRNLFYEGETYSELRIRGLQCVRDNIEAQMYKEREILSKMTKVD